MFIEYLKNLLLKLSEFEDYIIWACIFGTIHTLFSPKNRTIVAYFIAFITSVPVGVLAGLVAEEQGFGTQGSYVITAIGALIAQDLIKFILGISGYLQEHSHTLAKCIIDYLRQKFRKD
jgi:uncharacterized membrane protein YeaQ/YmgE (transglycosylase-associated protein family)